MSENKYDWVNLVLGKHVDLCILVASFVLRGMRKMWRENELEREIDGTLSLFSQSNRFVYLETTACPPESSFSRASRVSLDFFSLMWLSSFYTAFWFPSFWLVFIPSGRSRSTRSTAQMRRVQLRNSHLLGYTVLTWKNENNATLIQVIKVSPHLAEILTIKFNVTRKNCIIHPLHAVYTQRPNSRKKQFA